MKKTRSPMAHLGLALATFELFVLAVVADTSKVQAQGPDGNAWVCTLTSDTGNNYLGAGHTQAQAEYRARANCVNREGLPNCVDVVYCHPR